MTNSHRVLPCDALVEGGAHSAMVAHIPVAVARIEGQLRAFGALCPHQQADLSEGILEDGGVTCPAHLWHFELTSGACTAVPGASIPIYPVREEAGWIVVDLPA